MQVETAIGGMAVARTVEGRERYTINVRYSRELRDDPEKLKRVLVPVSIGGAAAVRRRHGRGFPHCRPAWLKCPSANSPRSTSTPDRP